MDSKTIVRALLDSDVARLAAMDLAYDTRRVLALERTGEGAEIRVAFGWRAVDSRPRLYNEYSEQRLRDAPSRADAFFVAETSGAPCGLLIIVVPLWTDAAEITDLAVDRPARGLGAGRALVSAAVEYARNRHLRALWVEPRSDNSAAIDFYLKLGFRISGFNDRMYSNGDDGGADTTIYMHLDLTARPQVV